MNQDQKKYLSKRLDDIKQLKVTKLWDKIPEVDKTAYIKKLKVDKSVFPLNHLASELIGKLLDSKCMPNDSQYNRFFSISESEMFVNYKTINDEYEEAKRVRESKVEERKTKIDLYVTKLKDEIMLGNSEEALKQLSQFEKMEF